MVLSWTYQVTTISWEFCSAQICANHATPKSQKALESVEIPITSTSKQFQTNVITKEAYSNYLLALQTYTSCGCLDSGLGVTAERYCGTLEGLLQAVLSKKKGPWFLRQDNGILHNAGPRMANGTSGGLWCLSGRLWTTPCTAPNSRPVIYSSSDRS